MWDSSLQPNRPFYVICCHVSALILSTTSHILASITIYSYPFIIRCPLSFTYIPVPTVGAKLVTNSFVYKFRIVIESCKLLASFPNCCSKFGDENIPILAMNLHNRLTLILSLSSQGTFLEWAISLWIAWKAERKWMAHSQRQINMRSAVAVDSLSPS